jgi:hypothetical protein
VAEALTQLRGAISSNSNVKAVVYTCLNSAAFYAMTDNSTGIIPIAKDGKGDYHVFGSLVVAPLDMFAKSVKTCLPLFSEAPAVKKMFFLPSRSTGRSDAVKMKNT